MNIIHDLGNGIRKLLDCGARVFVLALLSLLPGLALSAPVLYGVTFNDQLITINTTTGAGTLVGNLSSPMFAYGLGATSTNKLYAYDQIADRLRELNPATGATVNTIDLGLGHLVGEGGIDFRSDGVGFLYTHTGPAGGGVYSFTTSAGSGALVGLQSTILDGLAFSATDVLFALSQNTSDLYTVNQTTGALTLIGATGVSGLSAGGLDFIGSTLYAAIRDNLYTLNTTTGAATLVGAIGFTGVIGLGSLDVVVTAVPEPATLALVVLALAGFGFSRRKQ